MRFIAAAFAFLLTATLAQALEPFEVARLNAGLGPVPETLDRETPQTALEAFLDAADDGDFTRAAHMLNLNDLPESRQAAEGPELARQLAIVIDRKIVIDWNNLLERPDALDAEGSSEIAAAGSVRRSVLISMLEVNNRGRAIRLNRVQPTGADPVWVFSTQTVDAIPGFWEAYRPSNIERIMPGWMKTDAFWGLMWWEVFGLPVALMVAALAGWLAWTGFSPDRWRTDSFVARILRAVRNPAALFAVTLALTLSSKAFVFSGVVSVVLTPLIALGFTIVIMMLVVNVADTILDQIVSFEDEDLNSTNDAHKRSLATRLAAGRRLLIVIIVLVGAGIVLTEAQLFQTLGLSVLASASALTLILGFAARRVLGNIMSSIQIALNQSARIGDKVLFKDHLCNVERINFTFVQLRVWTGVRLIVPVEEFVAEHFENWTLKEPELTRLITLKLAHEADTQAMRQHFFDIIDEGIEEGELGDPDKHEVRVTDQDVFGKTITFCLHCANPNTAWAISCEMREKLIGRGLEMEKNGACVFPQANPAEEAA